jgi:hypothetical protein
MPVHLLITKPVLYALRHWGIPVNPRVSTVSGAAGVWNITRNSCHKGEAGL